MEYVNNWHQKAHELMVEGEANEAMKFIHKALEVNPDNANILSDRAVMYIQLGKSNLAIIDFDACIKLEPKRAYHYSSRAFLKARLKDVKGAREDYQKAIELDPEDAIAYNNLGLLEEESGYANNARNLFNKADTLAGIKTHDERVAESIKIKEREAQELEEASKSSLWKEVKKVFTQKNSWKEFIRFVKNGFKM